MLNKMQLITVAGPVTIATEQTADDVEKLMNGEPEGVVRITGRMENGNDVHILIKRKAFVSAVVHLVPNVGLIQ